MPERSEVLTEVSNLRAWRRKRCHHRTETGEVELERVLAHEQQIQALDEHQLVHGYPDTHSQHEHTQVPKRAVDLAGFGKRGCNQTGHAHRGVPKNNYKFSV